LLIVVRFEGHFRYSLPEGLFLLGAPYFRARLRSWLGGGVSGLFGKPKLAEACRLESHRLPRAFLLELEVRFPLLRAGQNRLRVAPCGRNSGTIAHLILLSEQSSLVAGCPGLGASTPPHDLRAKNDMGLSRGRGAASVRQPFA